MPDLPPKVLWQAQLRELRLPPGVKLVGLILSTWLPPDGIGWASVAQLAQGAGCSDRTARRALRQLEAAGLLERRDRPGRPSSFRVTPDTAVSALLEADPGHSSVRRPGHGCPPTPDTAVSATRGTRGIRGVARGNGEALVSDLAAAARAARERLEEGGKVKPGNDGEGP